MIKCLSIRLSQKKRPNQLMGTALEKQGPSTKYSLLRGKPQSVIEEESILPINPVHALLQNVEKLKSLSAKTNFSVRDPAEGYELPVTKKSRFRTGEINPLEDISKLKKEAKMAKTSPVVAVEPLPSSEAVPSSQGGGGREKRIRKERKLSFG